MVIRAKDKRAGFMMIHDSGHNHSAVIELMTVDKKSAADGVGSRCDDRTLFLNGRLHDL
jgi:hypothetical protein